MRSNAGSRSQQPSDWREAQLAAVHSSSTQLNQERLLKDQGPLRAKSERTIKPYGIPTVQLPNCSPRPNAKNNFEAAGYGSRISRQALAGALVGQIYLGEFAYYAVPMIMKTIHLDIHP